MGKAFATLAMIACCIVLVVASAPYSEADDTGTIAIDLDDDTIIRVYSTDNTYTDHKSDSTGDGWSLDTTSGRNVLTLSGYDGGSILFEKQMDIVLEGENRIANRYTESNLTITGLGHPSYGFGGSETTIKGAQGSTLTIESNMTGIFCTGNLTIEDADISIDVRGDAVTEAVAASNSYRTLNCLHSTGDLVITGCELDLSTARGTDNTLNKYNALVGTYSLKATDSTIVAKSPVNGIYSSNGALTLENCELDVTATGQAGIMDQFGSITLNGCHGKVNGYIGVYANGKNIDISIENCPDLTIAGSYYGILNNRGNTSIVNSPISLGPGTIGIYGTKSITATGSVIDGSGYTAAIVTTNPDASSGDFGWISGLIRGTDWVALNGSFDISDGHLARLDSYLDGTRSLVITGGSDVRIPEGTSMDVTDATSFTVSTGATLHAMGAVASQPIDNDGTVESVCTNNLTVTDGSNPISILHDWGEWTVTKEPGPETEGEESRFCQRDATHVETRPVSALGYADYSEVEEAIDRAEALDPDDYVDFSGVTDAIDSVIWDLDSGSQSDVDAMADAINEAIDALVPKPEVPPTDPDDDNPPFPNWGNDDDDYVPIPPVVVDDGDDESLWIFIVLGSVAASLFILFIIFDRRDREN